MATRLERLITMESEINRGRYPSVEYFCQLFSVKPRTVYEDLKVLRDRVGLDIQFDSARKGYYNASPTRRLPQFDMTDQEYFILLLAAVVLSKHLPTSFCGTLQTALDKVKHRLPGELAEVSKTWPEILSEQIGGNSKPDALQPQDINRLWERCRNGND